MTIYPNSPYFDDFDETKNFLSILFKPGYAVQARELTQLQTILSQQTKQVSSHIFADGSPIIGAEIKLIEPKNGLIFDALDSGASPIDLANFDQAIIRKVDGGDVNTGDVAKVTNIRTGSTTAFISYLGGEFQVGDKVVIRDPNESAETGTILFDATIASVHQGIEAIITDGIVYHDERFVRVVKQSAIVDWLANDGVYEIGYNTVNSVITSSNDTSLNDPANGSTNFNAEGADRENTELVLASVITTQGTGGDPVTTPDASFHKIGDVQNQVLLEPLQKVQYGDIINLLARRTSDESGDYTVVPFDLTVEPDLSDTPDKTILKYNISSGKAYIDGYEIEKPLKTIIDAPRPRTTQLSNNESVYAPYGVFIDVLRVAAVDDITGVFNIANRETVSVYSGIDGTGTVLSTTRVLSVTRNATGGLRIYLEWQSDLGDALTSGRSITGTSATANIGEYYHLSQSTSSSLLFPVARGPIESVALNETSYNIQKSYFSLSKNVSDNYQIFADDNYTNFLNSAQGGVLYVVDTATGNIMSDYTYITTDAVGAASDIEITPTPAGDLEATTNCDVILLMERTQSNPKTKTLTTSAPLEFSVGVGVTEYTLPHYDCHRITSLEIRPPGGVEGDYIPVDPNLVILFHNATDVLYDFSSVSRLTADSEYRITYRYFAHSGTGDYFNINSYMTGPNTTLDPDLYTFLPLYLSPKGDGSLPVRGCFDFRTTAGDLANQNYIVMPHSNIRVDYDYYLGRIDLISLNKSGTFELIQGLPSYRPETPPMPDVGTVLFKIFVPAYTHKASETSVKIIQKQTYTMDDIRRIEERLNKVEYYSAIALLEKTASDLSITDAYGLTKEKHGIMVDNFSDKKGNIYNIDYRLRVLTDENIATVPIDINLVECASGTLPAGVKDNVNTISLNFTESEYLANNYATDVINLNPYDVVYWEGVLTTNPPTDYWIDKDQLPDLHERIDNAVVSQTIYTTSSS